MPYFVNRTAQGIKIHKGSCHDEVKDRHGPFSTQREATLAARALVVPKVSNCDQCVKSRLPRGCHCEECKRRRRRRQSG